MKTQVFNFDDFTFIGLASLENPITNKLITKLNGIKRAGIRKIIITNEDKDRAVSIAK